MHSNLGEIHPDKTRTLHESHRPTPRRAAPTRITVSFQDRALHLELARGTQTLSAGFWKMDIALDSEPAAPIADYEESCWVADKDVNYLELEIQLSGGIRVERHLVFAREDQFMLLADAVFGPRAGRLEYRGSLPLAAGIEFRPDRNAREGTIQGKKPLAGVLPLALPEWRSAKCPGNLQAREGCLELSQTATGCNLFAPLMLDLKNSRFGKPLTWRTLTVAEALAILPPETAVGYRVMIGKEQWLIYRSLSPRANRSLLGHNLSSEFLLAKFLKNGEVQSLIEVE
jgi:hypothetical protein